MPENVVLARVLACHVLKSGTEIMKRDRSLGTFGVMGPPNPRRSLAFLMFLQLLSFLYFMSSIGFLAVQFEPGAIYDIMLNRFAPGI